MSMSENIVRFDAFSFSFNVSYMCELSQWYEFKSVYGYNGVLPEFPKPPLENVPFITGSITGTGVDVNSPFQTPERRDVEISLNVLPVFLREE